MEDHFELWSWVGGEAVVGEVLLRDLFIKLGFSASLSGFRKNVSQMSRSTRSLESTLPWGGPVVALGRFPWGAGGCGAWRPPDSRPGVLAEATALGGLGFLGGGVSSG